MALPDFLIIGAQKSGTTWLADQLARHPLVYMAPREIHFFDKEHNWNRGQPWYETHFAEAEGRLIGEKTPDYLWTGVEGAEGHMPDAHRHLYATVPNARLIVVLRNPVDRAISALTHLIRTRRVPPVHAMDALLMGDKQKLIQGHGIVEKGYYHRQLVAYAELFRPSQLLVLIFETDIAVRPADGMEKIWSFLGLPPALIHRSTGAERNSSRRSRLRLLSDYYLPFLRPVSRIFDRMGPPWKPALSSSDITMLYQLYEEENRLLFEFLNQPVPEAWLRPDLRASDSGDTGQEATPVILRQERRSPRRRDRPV
ncbi:MAG: sulfotransferase domain-containing protein [Gemmatimonadota bacterium]